MFFRGNRYGGCLVCCDAILLHERSRGAEGGGGGRRETPPSFSKSHLSGNEAAVGKGEG